MENKIDMSVPFLAKVRKVAVINKDGKTQLVVRFVYYATELLNGRVKDEEVIVTPEHHLYAGLSVLRSGDELRAIPLTNEITKVIPHNWFFRQLLKNNGL